MENKQQTKTCESKSRKTLLVATLLMLMALSAVAVGYAQVTVGSAPQMQGTVTYNVDNAESGTWSTTLTLNSPSDRWYSRLEINRHGSSGHVTIIWRLQLKTDFATWTDIPGATFSTSMTLSGNTRNVYATNDGTHSSSNYDWKQNATMAGTYRVVATVTA